MFTLGATPTGDSPFADMDFADLMEALSRGRGGTPRSAGGLAIDLSALGSTARLQTDARLANRTAHSQSLQQSLAANGVDTDAELQRLLALEQAYAANARVIKAADSMLNTLLEI